MPRNKLTDLHNILFEQLERLNDESLTGEELEKEIKRSKAVTTVSHTIIENANTILQAQEFMQTFKTDVPDLLQLKDRK